MDFRKVALENLLGSNVQSLHTGLYKWQGIYYEVVPYKQIKKAWSQFNKIKYGKTVFGYRELSKDLLKKYEKI